MSGGGRKEFSLLFASALSDVVKLEHVFESSMESLDGQLTILDLFEVRDQSCKSAIFSISSEADWNHETRIHYRRFLMDSCNRYPSDTT